MAGMRRGRGTMRERIAFAACLGLAACGAAVGAQPTIESLPLAAAYGDGVHAYFAGDYERAYEDLTQAIEAGTDDPRAFYFRGLSALRLGRSDEAEADFTAGADRESQGLGAWPVGRSLERIQGADRLGLERHRVRARVTLLQRQREAEQIRYSQIEAAQPDVLRRRRPVAPRIDDAGNVFEQQPGPGPAPTLDPADAAAEPMPEPAAEKPEADAAFGAPGPSKAEQVEELAAEREDVEAQRDQQAEQEAAAGDR